MLLGDNGSNIKNYLYLDVSAEPAYCRRPPTVSVRERFFLARFDEVLA